MVSAWPWLLVMLVAEQVVDGAGIPPPPELLPPPPQPSKSSTTVPPAREPKNCLRVMFMARCSSWPAGLACSVQANASPANVRNRVYVGACAPIPLWHRQTCVEARPDLRHDAVNGRRPVQETQSVSSKSAPARRSSTAT